VKKTIFVAAGILIRRGRVLLAQRHAHASYGGLWEFPGGKLEENESPGHALAREWLEELGVSVDDSVPYAFVCDERPGLTLVLLFLKISSLMGTPLGTTGQEVRWCSPTEARTLPMPPSDLEILGRLEREGNGHFRDTEQPEPVQVFVAGSEELAEGDVLLFEAEGTSSGRVRGFLLRTPSGVRAYENLCPHRPLLLNPEGGPPLLSGSDRLVCVNHGAIFDTRSGVCVTGPCRGEWLRSFDVVRSAEGWTVIID
jgi:8-oxo-dGTP diphosphatase